MYIISSVPQLMRSFWQGLILNLTIRKEGIINSLSLLKSNRLKSTSQKSFTVVVVLVFRENNKSLPQHLLSSWKVNLAVHFLLLLPNGHLATCSYPGHFSLVQWQPPSHCLQASDNKALIIDHGKNMHHMKPKQTPTAPRRSAEK